MTKHFCVSYCAAFQLPAHKTCFDQFQDASLDYFQSTKEEVFFLVMREVFHRAELLLKER